MASSVTLAGALAAIEAKLQASWTVTPVVLDNVDPAVEIPPIDGQGVPQPWVFCEIVNIPAEVAGLGTPGNRTLRELGDVNLYVMGPKGRGLDALRVHAVALGEIFRQQKFFATDPTAYVRTFDPSVMRGDMVSDDGNQVSVLCRIPFEFYHRA